MKIYICYLYVPDKDYQLHPNMPPTSMITSSYDDATETWKLIWAHTSNKKWWQSYKLIHGESQFPMRFETVKMSSEDYAKFYSDNRQAAISLDLITISYRKKILFPITGHENVYIDDWMYENYYEMIGLYASINPEIFNHWFQKELYEIYYYDDYMRTNASEEDREFFDYNDNYRDVYEDRKISQVGMFITMQSDFISLEGLQLYLSMAKEVDENDEEELL